MTVFDDVVNLNIPTIGTYDTRSIPFGRGQERLFARARLMYLLTTPTDKPRLFAMGRVLNFASK